MMMGLIEAPYLVILVKSGLTLLVIGLLLKIDYRSRFSSIPVLAFLNLLMFYVFFNNWSLIARAGGSLSRPPSPADRPAARGRRAAGSRPARRRAFCCDRAWYNRGRLRRPTGYERPYAASAGVRCHPRPAGGAGSLRARPRARRSARPVDGPGPDPPGGSRRRPRQRSCWTMPGRSRWAGSATSGLAVQMAVIEGLLEPPTLLTVSDTLAAGASCAPSSWRAARKRRRWPTWRGASASSRPSKRPSPRRSVKMARCAMELFVTLARLRRSLAVCRTG